MAIDLEAARMQQRELNRAADDTEHIKRRLIMYKEDLTDAWRSKEEKGVDAALEKLVRDISRVALMLEDVGHRIVLTAEELEEEEAAGKAAD